MFIIRKYQQQIDRFVSSGSCGAFSIAYGVVVFAQVVLAGLICKFGSPPMNGRPWDTPVILDGAWRIFNGQVSHKDFYNYLGDLPFYMTAMAMKLIRPCASAIDYGNVMLMAVISLPAMAVLRRRTSAGLAFLFVLLIALLVVTPKPMGDPYDYIDHAMLYNRYGEAFLLLFGIVVFLPPRPEFGASRAKWAEAVLAGIVMIALLGSKLNYFVVGAVLLGVGCLTGRVGLAWVTVCLASAAVFLAMALALSKIPISSLLADYHTMSGCQSLASRIRGLVIQSVKSIVLLPVLLLPIWDHWLGQHQGSGTRPKPWREVLLVLAAYGGAALLLSSNCQIGEMPLLALAALLGAELMMRHTVASEGDTLFVTGRNLLAVLLALLYICPLLAVNLKTIRFATFTALKSNWVTPASLQATTLHDFRFVPDGTRSDEMKAYEATLNEGIELLQRHPAQQTRLNAILFSDPFHIALGLPPASGGVISLTTDGLTSKSHTPLAQMIGNATYLLTDHGCAVLKQAYGAEWDALKLEVIEDTKSFTLYKIPEGRKAQSQEAPTPGASL